MNKGKNKNSYWIDDYVHTFTPSIIMNDYVKLPTNLQDSYECHLILFVTKTEFIHFINIAVECLLYLYESTSFAE